MQLENCGIVALQKIKTIEKVSAYSLIQMAKENNVSLHIYHVDSKDLIRVPRPAIIHTKDHFIHIKDGEVLPNHSYTGFYLSERGFKGSRIVSHAEAKQITGSKKGGAARFIVPTLLAFIPGVGPVLAAGANIGMSQYAKSNHPEQLGKAGNFLDILTEGATGYFGGKAAGGFEKGFGAAASGGGSILQNLGSGFKNIFPSLLPGGSGGSTNLASQFKNFGGGLAPFSSPNSAADLATGFGVIGKSSSPAFNLANTGTNFLKSSFFNSSGAGQGGIGNLLNFENAASLAGSFIGRPDTSSLNKGLEGNYQDYSKLRSYIGNDSPLTGITQNELARYIHTPLEQLTSEFANGNSSVTNQINQSFDRQVQNLQRQFAQSGQNVANSSDFRDSVSKLNNDRETALTQANLELRDQNLNRAVQAKQFALANGLNQNQFDDKLALELASLTGQQEELKLAIDTNNYNQFQSIIANILHMGYAQNQRPT